MSLTGQYATGLARQENAARLGKLLPDRGSAYTRCHNSTIAMYDRSFKKLASWTSDTRAAAVEYTAKYTGLYFVQITDLGIDPSSGLFGSGHERFVRAGLAAKGPAGRPSC